MNKDMDITAHINMGLNTQDIENIGQALLQIADSLGVKEEGMGWDGRRNVVDGLDNIASGLNAIAKSINKKGE